MWAYPGTAQIFGVPPIISGTGKAYPGTSNFVGTFIGSIGTKAHENVGNSDRGRSQVVPKIFRAPICRAHCAVIFAIAQLSCLLSVLLLILEDTLPRLRKTDVGWI